MLNVVGQNMISSGLTKEYSVETGYLTSISADVQDVQVNGTSVVSNGIANITKAIDNSSNLGVVGTETAFGIRVNDSGKLYTYTAGDNELKIGTQGYKPIVPANQHKSIFFGLSKVAGVDLANETVTIGTYPDSSKAAIQNLFGISDLLANTEASTATAAHAANSLFLMDGKLHRATSAIAIGDAVTAGTNCEVIKADEVFVKNTDIASTSHAGVVKIDPNFGVSMRSSPNQDTIMTAPAGEQNIKEGVQGYQPIVPSRQHISIYYGLSKLAGVDLKNETVTVGIYPLASRQAICSMIGALGIHNIGSGFSIAEDFETGEVIFETEVQDVQVNGNSIISNGVANIPVGSSSTLGVYKCGAGLTVYNGDTLIINPAGVTSIKTGTSTNSPITPYYIDAATFYGLSRAAGDSTQTASNNVVGVYTSEAQTAIQTMLGAQAAIEVIRL